MTTPLASFRFPPAMLETKPGPKGSRLTFVDVRNIAAVLDDLAPGWTSRTTLAHTGGEYYATVMITINGCYRADVGSGETPPDAANQAFRRAAAAHGLGRYLWTGEPAPKALPAPVAVTQDAPRDALLRKLHAIGTTLYNGNWEAARHKAAAAVSDGRTNSSADLTMTELQKMVDGFAKQQADRQAVAA